MQKEVTRKYIDDLTFEVVGAAIQVHKTLGKSLTENIYHECLLEELTFKKINFQTELKIPLVYRTRKLELDFRCDIYVEKCLVVELKSAKDAFLA